MLRIDAQHGFLPPAQDPAWLSTILTRNRFEGSVLLADNDPGPALDIATRFPYIRAVIARGAVLHPLVKSVYLADPSPEAIAGLGTLRLEVPAMLLSRVRHVVDRPVALDGIPDDSDTLPPNFYIKLTGFQLPATPEHRERLRRVLRFPGPERLMFATGWPFGEVPWKERLAAFTQALGAMPMPVREQILGGTACEFYGIAPALIPPEER